MLPLLRSLPSARMWQASSALLCADPSILPCRCNRGGSSRLILVNSPVQVSWPTQYVPSLKTEGGDAGLYGSHHAIQMAELWRLGYRCKILRERLSGVSPPSVPVPGEMISLFSSERLTARKHSRIQNE